MNVLNEHFPLKIPEINYPIGETQRRWHRIRLDRIIVDYLLREGHYNTAVMVAKDSNISVSTSEMPPTEINIRNL